MLADSLDCSASAGIHHPDRAGAVLLLGSPQPVEEPAEVTLNVIIHVVGFKATVLLLFCIYSV